MYDLHECTYAMYRRARWVYASHPNIGSLPVPSLRLAVIPRHARALSVPDISIDSRSSTDRNRSARIDDQGINPDLRRVTGSQKRRRRSLEMEEEEPRDGGGGA